MSKVSDEVLDAGREIFRRNPTLDLGTRLDLAYEAVALAERERLSSGAPSPDEVERLKRAIDSRLNDHLCDMKPNWDDSITGFNDAWDMVRAAFADFAAMNRAPQPAYDDGLRARLENLLRDFEASWIPVEKIIAQFSVLPQPSINAEMLAVLEEIVELEHERLTNSPMFAQRSVASILAILDRARAIIAKAEGAK